MQDFLVHKDISFTKIDGYIEVNNPATLKTLAYVRKVDKNEINEIIKRSSIAQKKWAEKTAEERADLILRLRDLMLQNKELLANILTQEQGKSLTESRGEIVYSSNFFRWFAEEARRVDGDIIQSKNKHQKILVIKQPVGVCASITPWNFPSAMIARKLGPALACGCSMISKSASQTPLSAYALEILAKKAGIPDDLFIVINGNASLVSEALCENDTVRKLTFTGSTEIGKLLYEKSASTLKKLSLELGGNAPFIIFDDADLDKAIDSIIDSKFRNSGQTCVCANRIYVQDSIYDKVKLALSKKVSELRLGNGLEEGINQGPLIDLKAVEKIKEHIQDAVSKGAKIEFGGKEHELGGSFFYPTVLSDATDDMQVANEETFGPIAPLLKFKTEEEVIKKANNTEYGLASYIFTENIKRKWRVAEALEYGMVAVNTGLMSSEVSPFGGVKHSGLGREGSKYGISEYLDIKYICVDIK